MRTIFAITMIVGLTVIWVCWRVEKRRWRKNVKKVKIVPISLSRFTAFVFGEDSEQYREARKIDEGTSNCYCEGEKK